MAYQTNSHELPEVVIGYPLPPSSSATPPPPPRWWNRPILTYPSPADRKPTTKESAAYYTPCHSTLLITLLVILILFLVDKTHYHSKFSIQSISVSPSSATWHVDFHVENPSRSRYSIYYGDDDVSVKLGPLNAAVLNTSHTSFFSLSFVAKNDVVSDQLDVKLRAKHKRYVDADDPGHVDISCYNLNQKDHNNIEKIQCRSSFTSLKTLPFVRRRYRG